jgi:hypothetical protein
LPINCQKYQKNLIFPKNIPKFSLARKFRRNYESYAEVSYRKLPDLWQEQEEMLGF